MASFGLAKQAELPFVVLILVKVVRIIKSTYNFLPGFFPTRLRNEVIVDVHWKIWSHLVLRRLDLFMSVM